MKYKTKYFDLFFFAVIAVIAAGLIFILYPYMERNAAYPLKYREQVEKYSNDFSVNKYLCYSVIKAESGFKTNAVSRSGAVGLMQITLPTGVFIAERFGEVASEEKLKEVDTNIKYGIYYLRYLSSRFDGTKEILAAYNAGEGRVREWLADGRYSDDGVTLSVIPYGETESYVKKVLKFYEKYSYHYN